MCYDDDEPVTYESLFGADSDDDYDDSGDECNPSSGSSTVNDPDGEAMTCRNTCSHPVVMKLLCTTCGQVLDDRYGLNFGYVMQDLRLSKSEADRRREIELDTILSNKKLILVLDLDETLLQSTCDLKNRTGELVEDAFEIEVGKTPLIVKLRPFVHKFLEEASTMFEIFVYTLSTKDYARKMISLLDPENKYVKSRLIAREDSTVRNRKNLELVLGHERAVVILDDLEQVWPRHAANLIKVVKYDYFARQQSEKKVDEKPRMMETYLSVLRKIHGQFFGPKLDDANVGSRDVRDVIRMIRMEILKGCKILLSHSLPDGRKCQLEKMAESMGAVCVSELDSSVTHVVTIELGKEVIEWAKKKKENMLVKCAWITECYMFWNLKYMKRSVFNVNNIQTG